MNDMNRVWDGLRACGCGENFDIDNTMILDNWPNKWTDAPANIIEVAPWAPGRGQPVQHHEDEMAAAQHQLCCWLSNSIAARAASVPARTWQ